jgi:hypothetical protein
MITITLDSTLSQSQRNGAEDIIKTAFLYEPMLNGIDYAIEVGDFTSIDDAEGDDASAVTALNSLYSDGNSI